ncbi:MAG TPA: hypothetical protein ENI23_04685 [bacterium]|nr:hypothetical protein [bacterium]
MPAAKDKKDGVEVDAKALERLAKEDPKSKKYNNPNSRKNLKQYKDDRPNFETVDPEIMDEEEEDEDVQAEEIVRGRKLSPDLVKKLIPKRGIFTPTEKKRFVGIVTQFLADFKTEEPTASDVDDIFEIAKADILEMRVLHATKNDPAILVASSQFLEKIYKRKQSAKENLASRRVDRKDSRVGQDISIVDLVVTYDSERKRADEERVESLLKEEEFTKKKLNKVLEEDGY